MQTRAFRHATPHEISNTPRSHPGRVSRPLLRPSPRSTDVLWTAGGSTKGPAKAAKAPKAPRASKASAKENQENVAVSQLHAMRGKSVSPDRRPDMQEALTLAALLGGGRPAAKEFAPPPTAAPQKGMPFADHNMGVQPTGYQMYPTMAGHNGAAGYYVYVPGPNENQ